MDVHTALALEAAMGTRPAVNEEPALRPTAEDAYREHHEFVWRCVRRMGVARDRAEDVVQDVFVVVAQRIDEFEGRSSLRTWLFAIAFRIVQEHRRRMKRERRPVPATTKPEPVPPDEQLARIEAARILDELLATLDDDKRAVFVLHELEHMEAAEIAASLGVNVNTVYSRLRLARKKLERALVRHRAKESRRRPWQN